MTHTCRKRRLTSQIKMMPKAEHARMPIAIMNVHTLHQTLGLFKYLFYFFIPSRASSWFCIHNGKRKQNCFGLKVFYQARARTHTAFICLHDLTVFFALVIATNRLCIKRNACIDNEYVCASAYIHMNGTHSNPLDFFSSWWSISMDEKQIVHNTIVSIVQITVQSFRTNANITSNTFIRHNQYTSINGEFWYNNRTY